MDAEAKACAVLEHLIDRLHDAEVDYQCAGSSHEFLIRHVDHASRSGSPSNPW
jgi:hypothetical protein